MARIGVVGGRGRMGHALAAAIAEAGHHAAGSVDRDDTPAALASLAAASDVLVDFSSPDALEGTLDAAIAARVPVLVGTTGLGERHHWLIDAAAERIPVLQTGNTSLGVTLLARLVRQAAAALGDDWDIEIIEAHHRHKVDAPSGTARLLGQAAAAGRGADLDALAIPPRDGITGGRPRGGIGMAAIRGGSIAGDHSVLFAAEGEVVTLAHHAQDRAIFARGAVRGALWLIGRAPGRHAMDAVLGLDDA